MPDSKPRSGIPITDLYGISRGYVMGNRSGAVALERFNIGYDILHGIRFRI